MVQNKLLMKYSRSIHNWGAILIAAPLIIVLITGVLLLLKKELQWVQPATVKQEQVSELNLGFEQVLEIATTVPEANIKSWDDVSRLYFRPDKGIIKVQGNNSWEVQIAANSGEVVQVAYRRSDFIESLHDGSFFGSFAKYWLFLPSALILIVLWFTGLVLFILPRVKKAKKKQARKTRQLLAGISRQC